MDVVNRGTGGLGASHEGVTAESDPEPRVLSEDSPLKSSAASAASESYSHVDTLRENLQCSIPKEASPLQGDPKEASPLQGDPKEALPLQGDPKEAVHLLGDPKEASSATHLTDTFKLMNSPSTELAATKGTAPEPTNQEENGSTLPPKGKSQDAKASFGVKKDTKVAAATTGGKRSILLKKDRMDPLKLDMTKPTTMPLTSSQQSLQCIECHIIFSDDKSKQRHLKMSHPAEYEQCMLGDSLFACYVCDRHFANSIDLMAHQRTHTEKQPFKCLLCGEAFKRSSELTTHKKVHCSSQGYKCNDCGKLCKTLTLLKYHSRTHTGEKPYVCKECGKRFSMPKALQRHIESHTQDEGDENGDGTNPAAKSKKQKSNAPTERKFSCPQCKAMFKTERTMLHHVKNKHAPNKNVPPSRALATQHLLNQGPPLLTQAAIDQPHVLHFDSGGQTPQCIEPEQIKRLIESLGNVQKVNQLVIYGLEPVSFQSQTMNLLPVPGVVQPIRFDMTQTVPSVEFNLVTEQAKSLDSEQANQQVESTAPELNGGHREPNDHSLVERTTQSVRQMQDHTGTLQTHAVELERISLGAEKTVTVEEPSSVAETILRESIQFSDVEGMRCETKTVETIQDNGQIQILEFLQQSSSLIPANELENENGHMVSLQEEVVQMQYMIPSDTLTLEATGGLQQPEEQVVTLTPLETQIVTLTSIDREEDSKKNVGNVSEQDVGLPRLETSGEPKGCVVQTELNKSQFSSEAHFSEEISLHPQPPLHGSDTAEVVAGEHEAQSQGTTPWAEPLRQKKGSRAKKTSKKEKAKRQISDLKQKTKRDVTVHTSQQKVLAPHPPSHLMPTVTQHSKTKGHILVQFGRGNKKDKLSKTAGATKRSKKRDDGELQEEGESQQKKKGEDRKGKTNKSENKTLTAILNKPQNQEQHVLQKEEAKAQLKSKKRKFKIHKSTDKSLTEKEMISSPLPKKKKQEKVKKPKPLIKTSKKEVTKKKTLELKQKEKEETPHAISPDQVKAEAMLLLKGHKQPQLKVHKLDDPKTLSQLELVPACPSTIACNEETPPTPMKESEDHINVSTKAKKQPRPIQACVESSSSSPNPKGTSMRKKVKAGRKRKTPKADGEMMPTSPSLTCDCGVKFSEVLALQEHVAAVHSGETQGYYGYSNGTLPEDHVKASVSSEVLPNNSSKTPGLQVTTDWDAEIEMGELGLGDREDQRVSFPALNPSPSLPHVHTLVEGEYEEVQKDANSVTTEKHLEVVSSGSKGGKKPRMVARQKDPPVSQTLSTCLSTQVATPEVQNLSAFSPLQSRNQKGKGEEDLLEAGEKISEMQGAADAMKSTCESDKAVEEDVKEELPLDVNLVTIQDENQPISSQEGDTSESFQSDCQMAGEIQVMQSHENVRESNLECLSHTENLEPVVDLNSTVTTAVKESPSNIPDIKQEDVEMTVHTEERKSGPNRNDMTRGRKRGAGRGRGRGTGKKRNMGSKTGGGRKSLNDDPDECQIVYQLYPVAADSEAKSLEGNVPQACPNPPRGVSTESQDDSSEEQVVFELESVTTSVVDMVKSEGELDRESQGSSPGIILEKFLTSRGSGSRESADISNQVVGASTNVSSNGTSTDHRTTTLPSLGTSGLLSIKEEDLSRPVMPPVLSPEREDARAPLINRSLSNEQGVQIFVVKEEDPLVLNEPHTVLQPSNGKRRDGHLSARNVAESDPPVECNMGERSVCRDELETVTSTVPRPSAKQCIFFPVKEEERELRLDPENLSTSGVEEHDDICEISTQHETACVDSALAEEDDMGAEQHNTEDLVEFLLKRPDREDSGGIDPEPEAETLAMSCYHGSRSSGSANPPVGSSPEPDQGNDIQLSQNGVGSRNGQRKPIDYFTQYFDSKTWQDVASITANTSKMSNPVTAKEVSQFVGIHIAMGTLKFPSTKLYWEDCTRVPLVADAMTASRFSEVLSKLRLAEEGGHTSLQGKDKFVSATSTIHQSTDHDSQVSETADDPHKTGKTCSTQSPLKTDPLNRVRVLMEKVQKTCQSLKREGNHGVSQYPLPLLRPTANPVHSLHHTVMVSTCGMVVDFNLCLDDSDREETVKKMVLSGENSGEGMVFLCKPELSTPSMLEQLLEAGVQSAGKVGGARGQVGDEFVSSDGKLKLFRCHHGFILSAAVKGRSRSTSLVSGFERALKAAKLNRDLRKAYRTPCLSSSPAAWPLSVLWHLTDLALVNSWLQHRCDRRLDQEPLSLMAFRLEVSKALILSSSSDAQDATPPRPPAPERLEQGTIPGSASIIEAPLPDIAVRYDGVGHWPEQVAEGEGARCRFGGCDRTSRVRCLKCCVFLCISRSHNCFLQFHSQGAL